MRLARFSDLARFRVHDILLVSSLYDAFILAEDGELHEVILKQFLDLNVRHTPGITHVSNFEAALALAADRVRYNLIIASASVGEISAIALAQRMREAGIDTPIVALAYDMRDVALFRAAASSAIERVFLWQGDVRLDAGDREVSRGPTERGARCGRARRPGDPGDRGQRPLLLLVPADDVRRADAPRAQPRARRRQSVAQADAPAGPAQDSPVHVVRGSVGLLRRLRDQHSRRDFGRRVPARRPHRPRRGARVRAAGAGAPAGRAGDAAVHAGGEPVAGARGGRVVSAQGLVDAVAAAAPLHGGTARVWRFRLPHARWAGSGARARSSGARGPAGHRAGRKPRLPRRAQSLLQLVQGADGVRARRPASAAQSVGLRDGRRPARGTAARDPRAPARHEPRRRGGLRRRHAPSGDDIQPRRRRLAWRQSARPRVRGRAAQPVRPRGALSARPDHGAAGSRVGHRSVRRVPGAELAARLRARDHGRAGARAPLRVGRSPGCGGTRSGVVRRGNVVSPRGSIVEPARGLAVPAVRGHLRHLHAAQRSRSDGRPAAAAADGDQARLRVNVQPSGQTVPGRGSVPSRRRKDGGRAAARGRRAARQPLLPGRRRRRPVAQFLSRCPRCGRKTAWPPSRSVSARPW